MRLCAGGRVLAVGEPRQQAVLAVLLLEAGRTVGVDALVDRVWGEATPKQVRRSLQAHLTRVRRVLDQAEPGGAALVRDAGGYRLDVRADQVDLFRFRDLQRGGSADRAALRAALDLWHGEPLAGLRGDWAERTRHALGQERTACVVAWADAEIRAGDAAVTITRLTELADEHPLQESTAATLMRALYAVGRAADALARYERVRRALREELGADPGPELAAVHQAVLRNDLPSRAVTSAPAQLPADVTAFTGRGEELAELDRVTARVGREPVVVCLTGTAGAGKTATAVHWGHRVRDRFPDGQLHVDLRGYDPDQPVAPTDALASFLTALLPGGAEIPLGPTERAARFRTEVSGRRMLIVLDNAATVDQVRPLLPGTTSCAVVVTSRDSLAGLVALHGAHRVPVDRLPGATAVALLRRLVGSRVDDDPESAAALADRCVRLPLALRLAAELAASRPASPLSRLVDELRADQRTLDLLNGGGDRRAAVRTVFSWSLRHLGAEAVRAFSALGRHPAPVFDAHVLAALTDRPLDESRAVLDVLVRAHLVQRAGVDRYGMHDLLRAYAAETGGGDDEHAALDRVHRYYLATAAAAMDLLYPGEAHRRPTVLPAASPVPEFTGPDDARDWLDAELATVEVLAAHAVATGAPEHAISLSALLFRFLDGYAEALALKIHEHARVAARNTGDRAAEATALTALGGVHLQASRAEVAAADTWAAFELFTEIGDVGGQARALGNVGLLEERSGHHGAAVRHYTGALAGYRRVHDVTGCAHALTRLGTIEARLGLEDAARSHLRQALELHGRAGHRFGEAWVKIGLGELATAGERLADAVGLHAEAAALFALCGHRDSEAWAVDGLGRTEAMRGRPCDAAAHHRQALDLFRGYGDRDGEAWSLNGLGEALHACGSTAAARASHAEALTVATRIGSHEQVARAHLGLARTTADDTARPHYDRAFAIYTELGLTASRQVRAELAGLAR
ncbi:BTAD domain-containing putative transcriptional regulator [Umezawaea endophytica]|uniref:Winged helix-turn-helix domain-containing protein n=1 Tax=Umezawaea endophytica TaxID=1654476 RepID=A0A9X2VG91_9PSEU|nr:BTAD domain-containing putative transcriptional regulator [Umezawaea endophytica]MCS7475879.1 winged helix-turn-helix domain-containing protein [Umezawaea endophytica]